MSAASRIGGYIFVVALTGCSSEVKFDREGWRSADTRAPTPTLRQQMLPDLLHNMDFGGMSRTQVIDLLGEPDSNSPETAGFPQWDMIYVLGLEQVGSYSLDDEALGFKFGPDDRVQRFAVSVN